MLLYSRFLLQGKRQFCGRVPGESYPHDTLLTMVEQVPSIRAIKDWAGNVPQHEMQIRLLQNLPRPVNVLTTHTALGCSRRWCWAATGCWDPAA
jgi:hypothetical protein